MSEHDSFVEVLISYTIYDALSYSYIKFNYNTRLVIQLYILPKDKCKLVSPASSF